MSYNEYLAATNAKDDSHSWIAWKTEICGMEPADAVKASYDPERGYEKRG